MLESRALALRLAWGSPKSKRKASWPSGALGLCQQGTMTSFFSRNRADVFPTLCKFQLAAPSLSSGSEQAFLCTQRNGCRDPVTSSSSSSVHPLTCELPFSYWHFSARVLLSCQVPRVLGSLHCSDTEIIQKVKALLARQCLWVALISRAGHLCEPFRTGCFCRQLFPRKQQA